MRAIQFMLTPSNGNYVCNEHTTEFGNISLDGSPFGYVSDCFIFRIQRTRDVQRKSFIDHYVNSANGMIATVRMVLLSGFEIFEDHFLSFAFPTEFKTPIFDLGPWQKIRSDYDENSLSIPVFISIEEERAVKLIHNGKDVFLLVYGDSTQEVFLSESISFFFDSDNNLQGIKVFSPKYVPEMLSRLKHSHDQNSFAIETGKSDAENSDKSLHFLQKLQRKFTTKHK